MNHFENNIDKEVQSRTMIHEQRQMLAQQMLLGTDEEYLALQTQAEILQAKHQQGYQFTQQELDAAARDMQIMQEKENALIQDMEANGLESEEIKERLRLAEQRGIILNEEAMNNIQENKGVPGVGGAGPGTKTRGAGMEKFTRSLSGYMMTASMVMGSLSMMGGEVGKVAQAITPLLGGFSMLTMLLQNMGKKMGFITLFAAAAAVVWLSITKFNDAISGGIDKVLEFTDSIGAGAKAIQGLADFAGKVTASEIMDRRREGQLSPFTVVSGKSTFGESFVESETGQATTKALGSASAAMGGASQQSALFAQLSTAVLSKAITTQQARSIAISIGKKMGNVNLGIRVAGELASLMGPNGEDILKNGLDYAYQRLKLYLSRHKNYKVMQVIILKIYSLVRTI
jgi:hypothetical protein